MIQLRINSQPVEVAEGTTVAAAVLNHSTATTRTSITGQPRGPLCGMGICFECRLTIDGQLHVRSCQLLCRPGMQVETNA